MGKAGPQSFEQRRRLEALQEKAKWDLTYLNTEILGYKVLGSRFSKQCQEFLSKSKASNRIALFAPRKSYKSLSLRGLCIQEILKDPNIHIAYISQERELALRAVNAIGKTLLYNEQLRGLIPKINRPPTTGKWLLDGEFVMPGRADPTDTTPTVFAYSTGQDQTGFRADLIIADDIIGKKVVREKGGVEYVEEWWKDTALPIIGFGSTGRAIMIGTFWSAKDLYQDVLTMENWECMVRGLFETKSTQYAFLGQETAPDPEGKLIDLWMRRGNLPESPIEPASLEDVETFRVEMGDSFGPQMLNIPMLDGEKSWPETEDGIYRAGEDLKKYRRTNVVLMDPAPIGTTVDHDYWANAVISIHHEKEILRRTLIDGRMSQEWNVDEGINNALDLAQRHDAHVIGVEEPPSARNAKFYKHRIEELCRKRGYLMEVVIFKTQMAKKQRMADLISMIKTGTFQICEDSLRETAGGRTFLDMFLYQGRIFPARGFDDCLDAAAFINDTALAEWIPQSQILVKNNFFDEEPSPDSYNSPYRYC